MRMGLLEQSVDAGKTWQAVTLGDGVSFRAVASFGTHVWAGGTDGAIFHSTDRGLHWTRIRVAQEDVELTGAVIGIQTPGPNRVKLSTSTGEQWTSADNGRQWKRE